MAAGFVVGVLFTVLMGAATTGALLWVASTEDDRYCDDL